MWHQIYSYLPSRKASLSLHTHPFNGPFSGITQVGRYQKGKTNLDFTEARDSEWQWHQLGHMQVCTSLQTDNHASTPPLSFLQAGCLSAAQPTASKHWRHILVISNYPFTQWVIRFPKFVFTSHLWLQNYLRHCPVFCSLWDIQNNISRVKVIASKRWEVFWYTVQIWLYII